MLTSEQWKEAKVKIELSREHWEKFADKSKSGAMSLDTVKHPDPSGVTNELRSAVELYEFVNLDKGKDGYFAYWKRADIREPSPGGVPRVTTWTGDTLGFVLEAGPQFTSPGFGFGSTRRTFSALCLDGHYYTGTYYVSSGDYVRMKRVKEGSRCWKRLKALASRLQLPPGESVQKWFTGLHLKEGFAAVDQEVGFVAIVPAEATPPTPIGPHGVCSECCEEPCRCGITPEVLKEMRDKGGTWAAYRNVAMDSNMIGHFTFLKVGPGCTFEVAPEKHPDTTTIIGWKYRLVGYVDVHGDGRIVKMLNELVLERDRNCIICEMEGGHTADRHHVMKGQE